MSKVGHLWPEEHDLAPFFKLDVNFGFLLANGLIPTYLIPMTMLIISYIQLLLIIPDNEKLGCLVLVSKSSIIGYTSNGEWAVKYTASGSRRKDCPLTDVGGGQ